MRSLAVGHVILAYAQWGRVQMADAEAETAPRPEMQRLVAALRARLSQLQTELREQEVSEASSRAYCRGFCQTLLQYAGSRGASEHILPFLEVYRISIQCFANARPYLTTECEDVLLVLGRLVLSCFELLLSIPESELPHEVWLEFHQSIQNCAELKILFVRTSVFFTDQISWSCWNRFLGDTTLCNVC